MKKIFLSLIFLMISSIGFSQTGLLCMNTPTKNYLNTGQSSINLNMKPGGPTMKYIDDGNFDVVCLIAGGILFTGAAILEGSSQYGTWHNNPQPGLPYNQTYSTKPFWEQTPRNVMLCVGVTLSISGIVRACNK